MSSVSAVFVGGCHVGRLSFMLESMGVGTGEDRRDVAWWLAAPFALRMVVLFGFLAPLAWAVPVALYGPTGDQFGGIGALGAPLGVALVGYWRNAEFWRLDRSSRAAVMRTVLTGEPSGVEDLDEIAVGYLWRAALSARSGRVAIPVLLVLIVVVFVTAAAQSTPWWLLGLVVVSPLLAAKAWQVVKLDPWPRLARLQERRPAHD